eukprot:scaffold20246_cov58-Phaeocystis_antarctica.AAC.3
MLLRRAAGKGYSKRQPWRSATTLAAACAQVANVWQHAPATASAWPSVICLARASWCQFLGKHRAPPVRDARICTSRSSGRSKRSIAITGASARSEGLPALSWRQLTGRALPVNGGHSTGSSSSSQLEQGAGRGRAGAPFSFLACATLATQRSLSSRASPSGIVLSLRGSKGWCTAI